MSTSKTGKGGTQPPKQVGPKGTWETSKDDDVIDARQVPPSPEEDLGLTAEEAFEPDPKGFEPSSQRVEEIAGRKMIPLSKEDLSNLHKAHAPNESMVPDPYKELSDRHLNPNSPAFNDEKFNDDEVLARGEVPHHIHADQVATDLLGDFAPSAEEGEETPSIARGTTFPKQNLVEDVVGDPSIPVDAGNMEEAARVLEALVRKSNQARREGDLKTAAELTTIAQKIVAGSNLKRQQIRKERHPALRKLLTNLGLEKIKHTDVKWLGSTWRFAARPAPLDYWLGANTGPEGLELNAAIVAAGLVGLDDEEGIMHPIWKVHNISLTARYEFEVPGLDDLPPVTEEVNIPVYHKLCEGCSLEVDVENEACPVCNNVLDPYDLPIDLRIRCAESSFKLLTEKLCLDALDLGDLVNKYREAMPDRKFDKEEVFPFVKLLPKRKEMET